MNRKLVPVLAILIFTPLVLSIVIGRSGLKSELQRLEGQALVEQQIVMKGAADSLSSLFTDWQKQLVSLNITIKTDSEELRTIIREHAFADSVFILNNAAEYIFPPENGEMSADEEQFLASMQEMGLVRGTFLKYESEKSQNEIGEGWLPWYKAEGSRFLFWIKQNDAVIGFDLNPEALMAEIINKLPDNDPLSDEFRIRLYDATGMILYQWGLYEPSGSSVLHSELTLQAPLNSWHFKSDVDPSVIEISRGRYIQMILIIMMVFLFVALAGIYWYRESTRDMREAMQKVSFVNQVSHELKTPLTNIRLYAELLENITKEEKNSRYLGIITAESRRLSRLIDNVLTFARKQKQTLRFEPVKVVPDEIFTDVCLQFEPWVKASGMSLLCQLESPDEMLIDRDFTEQILGNLISNAVKYARDGKEILISSQCDGAKLILSVRDYGSGIPADQQEKIFKPFYRVSHKLTEGVSGTGIGLSLVKTLTGMHGGSVYVQNRDPGAEFIVELTEGKIHV